MLSGGPYPGGWKAALGAEAEQYGAQVQVAVLPPGDDGSHVAVVALSTQTCPAAS